MSDADQDVYAYQVATIASGIKIMIQQIDLTQSLIDEYSQLVKLIEIEHETSRLTQRLPSEFTNQILTRIEELKLVEAQKQSMQLLVEQKKLLGDIS